MHNNITCCVFTKIYLFFNNSYSKKVHYLKYRTNTKSISLGVSSTFPDEEEALDEGIDEGMSNEDENQIQNEIESSNEEQNLDIDNNDDKNSNEEGNSNIVNNDEENSNSGTNEEKNSNADENESSNENQNDENETSNENQNDNDPCKSEPNSRVQSSLSSKSSEASTRPNTALESSDEDKKVIIHKKTIQKPHLTTTNHKEKMLNSCHKRQLKDMHTKFIIYTYLVLLMTILRRPNCFVQF